MGPIARGGSPDLDERSFVHRVHDFFLATYWYIRADASVREGFYDDPITFTDALLRTGVFQHPRLPEMTGKTFDEKRILIDDHIREFIGQDSLESLRIVTPVKAVFSNLKSLFRRTIL
jgi:hypothetical protein